MKRTILATLITAASFGSVAAVTPVTPVSETLQELTGNISQRDMAEYKEVANSLDTNAEKIEFAKKVIVAETSTSDVIDFMLSKGRVSHEDLEAKFGDDLFKENRNGELVLDKDSDAYVAVNARRDEAWTKHVELPVGDKDIKDAWLDEDGNLIDKDLNAGNDPINVGEPTDDFIDPIDVIVEPIDPILIDPVQPIAGNPDAIKAHAHKAVVTHVASLSNEDKMTTLSSAAATRGLTVDSYQNANGETILTFTDADGNVQGASVEQFNEYMANAQKERTAERQEEGDNPINGGKGRKAVDAIKDYVDAGDELHLGETGQGKVMAASQQAQAQTQSQIDELYALGNQNASDIDTLFSEVDRLDTRIDQTQALNAATVNARPMVTNGMTAFGAGVGYAGSEAALAIGVAHAFVDTGWSASGTLAASSDDVVVGAGAQYAF
ncbi:YadA C-terminal domain-containing protein [Vibrio lentus]|uniref:YadA C-terminal domain-containing protein n=1 Tax=Vibrio lentus TaxID=136468 RepID=UPI000C849C59|nr:YadA C-terminal domain-containing protein [Vibrio lentus]PMI94895.1 hypothetical protein BCU33_15890 [Vibrio lentus]